jgi:hypothetical protein
MSRLVHLLQIEFLAEVALPKLAKKRFGKVKKLVFDEIIFWEGLIRMKVIRWSPIWYRKRLKKGGRFLKR